MNLIFIKGNLNGQRHINIVVEPLVLLFLLLMSDAEAIFTNDNTRPTESTECRRWLFPSKQFEKNSLACHIARFAMYRTRSSRKHAYSNIQKISPPETETVQMKKKL